MVVRLAPSTPTIPLAPPAADATLPVAPDSNPGITSTDPTGGLVGKALFQVSCHTDFFFVCVIREGGSG